MSIGYACQTIGVSDTDLKSCLMKNVSETRMSDLIAHNLSALEKILDYNIENKIRLFRISSDLIPFGSSSVNNLPWWDIFAAQFSNLGEKIRTNSMRVSMHPGQYTVLNSLDEEVVMRAVKDLNYHTRVMDSLGVGAEHKIVLHIGGIYNDKKQAVKRFVTNYHQLDEAVRGRLVLENDDKSYTIYDVLEIGTLLNAPVIFDNLHHEINSWDKEKDNLYWIDECRKTWKEKDGNQKVHYSQQDPLKKLGSHSRSIRINEFMDFYKSLEREDLDIMLEVKDKNLSAVKCINCTSVDKRSEALEIEWSRYKYQVLERSPSDYVAIQRLLRTEQEYPAITFYNLIEGASQKESTIENSINAALHIWRYFNDAASDKETNSFYKSIENCKQGTTSVKTIKSVLWKIAYKYNRTNFIDSYYFH